MATRVATTEREERGEEETRGNLTVFLRLCSGETFEDIPITDCTQTLKEFLDNALKDLEV